MTCFADTFKTCTFQIKREVQFVSSEEIVLKQEAGVKAYDSESPPTVGLKAGAFADVGTLILTNRRLVYVNKGGASRSTAYVLGGALAARAVEKNVSQAEIDDLMKYEGSYFIPLQEITKVQTARKMGGGYLRVDNCRAGLKPAYSFIFGSGWSKNEDWVDAINSAIANSRSVSTGYARQQPTFVQAPPPPPPPPPPAPVCPSCGKQLTYIPQYQRWYCYNERKYV
jgi:hypothetical protein